MSDVCADGCVMYVCMYSVCISLWFSAAEEAMISLFHIHPSPDSLLSGLVAALYDRLYPFSSSCSAGGAAAAVNPAATSGAGDEQGIEKEQPVPPLSVTEIYAHEARLSRLLFALGQGAICSVCYTERLASASKRERDRQAVIEKDARSSAAREGGAREGEEADSMEAEMGMAAAADADHEQVPTASLYVCLFLSMV